ncbi:hypothetical protein GLV97_06755 [Halobacillus litoralis]|nr:hypothetical protein [Halobacillus litoralis]
MNGKNSGGRAPRGFFSIGIEMVTYVCFIHMSGGSAMRSRSRKWLYLPIETKVREQDAKLLLAYHAVNHGYHVVIGEHRMVEQAAEKLPAGIFLAKGYPKGYARRVVESLKKYHHKIVELDEEGLFIPDASRYIRQRMRKAHIDQLDHVCCWGEHQKQVLTNAYPEMGNRCTVTGNPRFDLLNEVYRELYDPDVKAIQAVYGSYFLINTRFTFYNPRGGLRENPALPETQKIKRLCHSFIQLARILSRTYPDKNVIFRPHPGESLDVYKEAFKGFTNIHILREGSVIHWILAAEAVIHNGCTTGIEGVVLRKPVISYQPVTHPSGMMDFPDRLSIHAYTDNEVIKILQQSTKPELPDLFFRYYGHPAVPSACAAILNVLNNQKPAEVSIPSLKRVRFVKDHREKMKRLFPSFSIEEIDRFFTGLNKLTKENPLYRIHPLSDRLYLLESL